MLSFWNKQPGPIRYLVPRILALAASWLLATVAIFGVLFVLHDPLNYFVSQKYSPQQRQVARRDLGLDAPAYRLYFHWLGDMSHGDLGFDYYLRAPTARLLVGHLQPTSELMVLGVTLGAGLAATVETIRRRRRSLFRDGASDLATALLGSLPVFTVGVLLLIVPADK